MASMQLRQLIDNILEDTSRDMREQCDTVDVAFQKRVTEMEDAKTKMEENLRKVRKYYQQSLVILAGTCTTPSPSSRFNESMKLFLFMCK